MPLSYPVRWFALSGTIASKLCQHSIKGGVRSAHSAMSAGLLMCLNVGHAWRGCTVGRWDWLRRAGAVLQGTIAAAAQGRRTQVLAMGVLPSATVRAARLLLLGGLLAGAGACALWARSALPDLDCRRRVQRGCTATGQALGLRAGRAMRGTSAEGSTTRTPRQPCAPRGTTVRRGRCCRSSVLAGRTLTLRGGRARPRASLALRDTTVLMRT
mmetsp:Transcript_32744/g.68461  ORF Transcript_32744/g.68461 Transcript_32744/m.68461 type:complete len:213 (-) Transcript_32744:1427-2065(-)